MFRSMYQWIHSDGAAFDESSDTVTDGVESATVFGPGISTDDFGLPSRVTTVSTTIEKGIDIRHLGNWDGHSRIWDWRWSTSKGEH